jgi:septal ring factor EnvC (AmiA/AmiB activator)
MVSQLETRTAELRRLLDAFEKERDKLLDQVQYLKGNADRMEWVIRVINTQLNQIENEEKQREIVMKQQAEAMILAKEQGNVGTHPSERKTVVSRRNQDPSDQK